MQRPSKCGYTEEWDKTSGQRRKQQRSARSAETEEKYLKIIRARHVLWARQEA